MTLIESLKETILDYQELNLPQGVPRRMFVRPAAGKAVVCIGVRRSGKSTYLYQLMEKLTDNGTDHRNILHLNFFDDRLHNLHEVGLGVVTEAFFSLYPDQPGNKKVYFFFDEIQLIPGWVPFVERLMHTQECEVYITGSSAQMRGRAITWEIYPFSFREFHEYKGVDNLYRKEKHQPEKSTTTIIPL